MSSNQNVRNPLHGEEARHSTSNQNVRNPLHGEEAGHSTSNPIALEDQRILTFPERFSRLTYRQALKRSLRESHPATAANPKALKAMLQVRDRQYERAVVAAAAQGTVPSPACFNVLGTHDRGLVIRELQNFPLAAEIEALLAAAAAYDAIKAQENYKATYPGLAGR